MACCPPFISTCSAIACKFDPPTLHHSNVQIRWNSSGSFFVLYFFESYTDRNSRGGQMIKIHVRRDSVCMGDDATAPNAESFFFQQNESIDALMRSLCGYVPHMKNVVWEIICSNTAIGYLLSDDTGRYQYEISGSVRSISELPTCKLFCRYHHENLDDFTRGFRTMNSKR